METSRGVQQKEKVQNKASAGHQKNRPSFKDIPIHPFLFAVFPIFALYSYIQEQLTPTQLIVPSGIALGAALIVTALLWLIFKDIRKSAILASVSAVLFLTTGHIGTFLAWVFPGLESGSTLSWALATLICLCLIFGLFAFMLLPETRRYLANKNLVALTVVFNVVGIVLVLMPAANIIRYEAFDRTTASSLPQEGGGTGNFTPEHLPDIYCIVLDGYARADTLQELYGHDNSPFTDYLEDKGFYVASGSRSNYNMTWLSLPSALNMQYVNDVLTSGKDPSLSHDVLTDMFRNNEVVQLLKARDYTYVHFSSGIAMTDSNKNADLNYRYFGGMSEFSTMLLQQTMAYPILRGVLQESHRERVLFTFSRMADLQDIKGPKFVFAHINCPHPPFVFGPNGEPVPGVDLDMEGWSRKDLYLDQLVFINGMTMTLIDEILSESTVPPIIVLLSDHGPASLGPSALGIRDFQMTDEFLRERFGILAAYYLPGEGADLLYQTITPVNSFRVIFDFYFGTDFGLLEDKNYYQSYWPPYEFFDATDRLKGI